MSDDTVEAAAGASGRSRVAPLPAGPPAQDRRAAACPQPCHRPDAAPPVAFRPVCPYRSDECQAERWGETPTLAARWPLSPAADSPGQGGAVEARSGGALAPAQGATPAVSLRASGAADISGAGPPDEPRWRAGAAENAAGGGAAENGAPVDGDPPALPPVPRDPDPDGAGPSGRVTPPPGLPGTEAPASRPLPAERDRPEAGGAALAAPPARPVAASPEPVPLAPRPASVIGTDDRVWVSDTSVFPWAAIAQLTIVHATGAARATGVMIGPQHMLTAGHAVLDNAYGGDGAAVSIRAAFGLGGDTALGVTAEMAAARALPGWVSGRETGADLALVTLDRSIGTVTGWFETFTIAMEDFFAGVNVNIAGYPADLFGGEALVLSTGPVAQSSGDRLLYGGTLDTAGGMSGAPIWQYFSATGQRQLVGIHTTGVSDPSAPGALNGGTRLTAERLALIEEWIGQDAFLNPPQDLADLAALPGSAELELAAEAPGAAFTLDLDLVNLGTAASAPFEVRAYLSLNDAITVFDLEIAARQEAGLAPLASRTVTLEGTLPPTLPSGSFRLGWLIDPDGAVAEFDAENNAGVAPQELALTGQSLPNLTASGLTFDTTLWHRGETVSAAWTVANAGAAAAPATEAVLLLSPDPLVTAQDRVLLSDSDISGLDLGAARQVEGGFTVPADLAPGLWHVAALVDPGGAVAEIVTTDNITDSVSVTVANRAPQAAPDSGVVMAGQTLRLEVLVNDTDPEGGGVDLMRVMPALQGRVWMDGDAVLYSPLHGATGTDSFDYEIEDGEGATARGTVTVTVMPAPPFPAGEGPDRLTGTPAGEAVSGLGGADMIDGRGGADTLSGGAGDDRIFGGDGSDTVRAGAGADLVLAGAGADTVAGEEGDDRLFGQAGGDSLSGGAGADLLDGGGGPDTLSGEAGDDRLTGGAGADSLDGGAGADLVLAGAGDDLLAGGPGDDSLDGEAGADVFLFAEGDGDDRVAGFVPGEDLLHIAGSGGVPVLSAGPGGAAVLSYGASGDTVTLAGLAPAGLDAEALFLLV